MADPRPEFKDALLPSSPTSAPLCESQRIEIIDLLAQGERNVEAIAEQTGLAVANTSRHLQVLKGANLVAARKERATGVLPPCDPMVLRRYRALQELSEARLAEVGRLVDDYFGIADGLERSRRRSFCGGRGGATSWFWTCVRRRVRLWAHQGGALHPAPRLGEAPERVAERAPHRRLLPRALLCPRSEAVRLLRKRGVEAVRLKEGYPEWRDAGLPCRAESSRAVASRSTDDEDTDDPQRPTLWHGAHVQRAPTGAEPALKVEGAEVTVFPFGGRGDLGQADSKRPNGYLQRRADAHGVLAKKGQVLLCGPAWTRVASRNRKSWKAAVAAPSTTSRSRPPQPTRSWCSEPAGWRQRREEALE